MRQTAGGLAVRRWCVAGMLAWAAWLAGPALAADVKLSEAEQAWLRAHPEVSMALDQDNPPLNFRRVDGDTMSGASVDYARLVALKTGLRLRWVGSSWDLALKRAMAHEVDALLGARARPERMGRLAFSQAYLELPIALATRAAQPPVASLADFGGLRVAVVKDSARIPVLRLRCPACVIVEVASSGEGIARVLAHQADGLFDDLPVVQRLLADTRGLKVALLYYHSEAAAVRFAVRNDAPELLAIIDKGLAAIGPDEHQVIRARWLLEAGGVPEQRELALSPAQLRWREAHPVVRIGVHRARAPIEWLDDDGTPHGMSVELLHRIGAALGLHIELVPLASTSEAVARTQDHGVDGLASMSGASVRLNHLRFSDPFVTTPVVLYTPVGTPAPGGLPALAGKRVAVMVDTSAEEWLRRDWPGIVVVPVASTEQAIATLRKGGAQAYLGALLTGTHQLIEMGATDVRVSGETDYRYQFSFAVRSDWPELVEMINLAMAAIPRSERDAIRQQWNPLNEAPRVDYRPLVALLVAIAVALAFIFQLRRMVRRRTAALESEIAVRRANEAELLHFRRHLQDLVAERTSELAAAKEAAVAGNLAKSVFLSNMSHELRTPLNAILGFSELLRHEANISPAQRKTLDLINRSGENLLTLINDVLDMSKIEADRLAVERAPFDIVAMLADVVELMRVRAETRQLTLRLVLADDAVRAVCGDEAKLRQSLINLVGNAIKFTERGGVTVSLSTRAWAPAVPAGAPCCEGAAEPLVLCIAVQDSGAGIAAADQARVFEPFVQVGVPNAQKGTGLGLSITRKLVELMGGTLQLDSAAGQGACFTIAVPVVRAQAGEASVRASQARVTGLAPGQGEVRILIVEDQMQNWLLLQRLMEDAGLSVRVATNGELGIEAFLAWQPQLIWMDHRMPVMDGIEATCRIRALPGGAAVKIVAVTASAFQEERDEVMAAGMDDFVRKPYRQDELFDCLERHLGVLFVRAEAVAAASAPADARELVAADLQVLPAALRASLRQAVVALDQTTLAALLAQIEPQEPRLAGAIAHMATAFRYRELCELIDAGSDHAPSS